MNYKITFNNIDSALNAKKMFELRQHITISILDGKYRAARKSQKELAALAVKDFDAYKSLPKINFKNAPFREVLSLIGKSIKFRLYYAFDKKTPEEKLLTEKYKIYRKNLTPEEERKKTIDITIPSLY